MEADNAPKWWHAGICKIERKHAEIMHINIDNTLNGGENTRSGENTHTYPRLRLFVYKPQSYWTSPSIHTVLTAT